MNLLVITFIGLIGTLLVLQAEAAPTEMQGDDWSIGHLSKSFFNEAMVYVKRAHEAVTSPDFPDEVKKYFNELFSDPKELKDIMERNTAYMKESISDYFQLLSSKAKGLWEDMLEKIKASS